MDKDKNQFVRPNQTSEGPLQEALRIADSFYDTPEKQPAAYQFIKDIEEKVYSFRETAIEIEQRKGREVRLPLGYTLRIPAMTRPPEKIMKELIEEEWKVGGDLFGKGKGYAFGLGPKGKLSTSYAAADWYHTTPNAENPKQPHVVHFVTTSTHLDMRLTDGLSYAPTLQDLERFVHGSYGYLSKVRELYPLDATIDELMQEIAAAIPDDISELVNSAKLSSDDARDNYRLAA